MPPQRRIKLVLVAVFTILVVYFMFSGDGRKIQNRDFYKSTLQAMEAQKEGKESAENAGLSPKPIQLEKPAEGENVKPNPQDVEAGSKNDNEVEMEEISIAGRTKMQIPKVKSNPEESKQEGKDHGDAKDELNGILKRSPIIIFSKSYCPFSAKAKNILLNRYSIVPAPYVVELDQHPLGKELQAVLGDSTGRRTVPNVLVNGKSIGGGDDIAEQDESGQLAGTLKAMGGKWIADVQPV